MFSQNSDVSFSTHPPNCKNRERTTELPAKPFVAEFTHFQIQVVFRILIQHLHIITVFLPRPWNAWKNNENQPGSIPPAGLEWSWNGSPTGFERASNGFRTGFWTGTGKWAFTPQNGYFFLISGKLLPALSNYRLLSSLLAKYGLARYLWVSDVNCSMEYLEYLNPH